MKLVIEVSGPDRRVGPANAAVMQALAGLHGLEVRVLRSGVDAALALSIETLDVGQNVKDAAAANRLFSVADVAAKTEGQVLAMPHFGRKGVNTLKRAIQALGVDFGMGTQWHVAAAQVARAA